MTLYLKRQSYNDWGIISILFTEDGKKIAETLEHAYPSGNGHFLPKIPMGQFVCARGPHRLASMKSSFETFEVTGITGHSNILFHQGNYNKDSEGCILLGEQLSGEMITQSKTTFSGFMQMLAGVNQFNLVVS